MKVVVSASRRVDMINFYADELLARINSIGFDNIHTLVIWTKNPTPLLVNPELRQLVKRLHQVFLLLTITSLGGTPLEPNVPRPEAVLGTLPDLVELLGKPERINIRYDPLVEIRVGRNSFTNIDVATFEAVARAAGAHRIPIIRTSYITIYKKVLDRLARLKMELVDHGVEAATDFIKNTMMPVAARYGIQVKTCVIPSLTKGGCIDADILTALHPHKEPCSSQKDPTQRPLCQCTRSLDIGRWYKCYHGCVYCYGNPVAAEPVR